MIRICSDILREIISVSRFHHDRIRSRESATDGDSGSVDGIEPRDRRIASRPSNVIFPTQSYIDSSIGRSQSPSHVQSTVSIPDVPDFRFYNLPTHTHELGSLPIHESFTDRPMNQEWTLPSLASHSQAWEQNPYPSPDPIPYSLNSNLASSIDTDMSDSIFISQSLISQPGGTGKFLFLSVIISDVASRIWN